MENKGVPLGMFSILWLFWMVLVGKWDLPNLAVGSVMSLVLAYLNRDLLSSTKRLGKPGLLFRIVYCLMGLIKAIIEANLQVAAIVLHPKLPISPTIVSFRSKLTTDLGKTILGNSITLTPGTLTMDLEGDTFTVHSLTVKGAESLRNRPLEEWLLLLEDGGGCE